MALAGLSSVSTWIPLILNHVHGPGNKATVIPIYFVHTHCMESLGGMPSKESLDLKFPSYYNYTDEHSHYIY